MKKFGWGAEIAGAFINVGVIFLILCAQYAGVQWCQYFAVAAIWVSVVLYLSALYGPLADKQIGPKDNAQQLIYATVDLVILYLLVSKGWYITTFAHVACVGLAVGHDVHTGWRPTWSKGLTRLIERHYAIKYLRFVICANLSKPDTIQSLGHFFVQDFYFNCFVHARISRQAAGICGADEGPSHDAEVKTLIVGVFGSEVYADFSKTHNSIAKLPPGDDWDDAALGWKRGVELGKMESGQLPAEAHPSFSDALSIVIKHGDLQGPPQDNVEYALAMTGFYKMWLYDRAMALFNLWLGARIGAVTWDEYVEVRRKTRPQ